MNSGSTPLGKARMIVSRNALTSKSLDGPPLTLSLKPPGKLLGISAFCHNRAKRALNISLTTALSDA